MPIVTLDLNRAWITDPADPGGARIVCGTQAPTGATATLDGAIRHYAGNRVQAEVYDQDELQIPLTLRHLAQSELQQLLDWRGVTVLLRRPDGTRTYCTYLTVTHRIVYRTIPEDSSDTLTYDADVVFVQVSYDEAV